MAGAGQSGNVRLLSALGCARSDPESVRQETPLGIKTRLATQCLGLLYLRKLSFPARRDTPSSRLLPILHIYLLSPPTPTANSPYVTNHPHPRSTPRSGPRHRLAIAMSSSPPLPSMDDAASASSSSSTNSARMDLTLRLHWCHQCEMEMRPLSRVSGGLECPRCQGGFIEQVSAASPKTLHASWRANVHFPCHASLYALSDPAPHSYRKKPRA